MDDVQKQLLIDAVTKVVINSLPEILKSQRTNFLIGTVQSVNYNTNTASVTIEGDSGGAIAVVPYPDNILDSEIMAGQRVLIICTDSYNSLSMLIVAVYGNNSTT